MTILEKILNQQRSTSTMHITVQIDECIVDGIALYIFGKPCRG